MAQEERRRPLVLKFRESLSSDSMGNAWVCLVPVPNYVEFITEEDGQRREYLLAPNVRNYLGQKGVNAEIQETLIGDQDREFWWLNNGITIVATKINPSTRDLVLENPRIVNGLQTSRELHNYSKARAIDQDRRHVLVRIIEVTERDLFNKILKTTNRQARIANAYFHSTEDIHGLIELAFPKFGLYYERFKNQYYDEKKPKNQIVTLPYLLQALIAIVLGRPDQARGRPQSFADKEYDKLFRKDDEPELYANAVLLMKRIEVYLSSGGLERGEIFNLKFYVARYLYCCAAKAASPRRNRIGQLDIETAATDAAIQAALDAVWPIYEKLTENIGDPYLVAKGPDMREKVDSALSKRFAKKKKVVRRRRQ
jgi:hypothetical protein